VAFSAASGVIVVVLLVWWWVSGDAETDRCYLHRR
jgi:hypothetical protein